MPESVRLILSIIDSPKRLQKLIATFGGTQVRVPFKKIPENSLLSEILGINAMQRFMNAFGGTEIYIPLCTDFLCRMRNVHIVKEYNSLIKKGISKRNSIDYLAHEHKMSARHMRNILKNNAPDIKLEKK